MTAPSSNRAQGDTNVLLDASKVTDTVAENMKQHAATLRSRLVPMEQALVGKAGSTLTTFKSDYQASLDRLYLKLKDLSVQIRRTAQAHAAADADSSRRLVNAAGGETAPNGGGMSASLNR
jgi:uncharacterized protein YukE